MTDALALATIEIDRKYLGREGIPDKPYIVICSGGQKTSEDAYPCVCANEDTAVRLWKEAIADYAKGKKGYLHWRVRPVMKRFHMTIADERQTHRIAGIFYTVYSRLLISEV